MRLPGFGKVDGQAGNRFDRAAWLTPVFDLALSGLTPPDVAYPPEVFWGPWVEGAPWLRYRKPEVEQHPELPPPPPPPNDTPSPEFSEGPPILGAPWFRIPFQEGLRGSPGAGTIVPGDQRPRWQNPRVTRVLGRLAAGVPQTPDQKRQRRHSEEVQVILNSLLDQGYIRLQSQNPLRFVIVAGGLQGAGPPTADTDKSQGAIVGCSYVDTSAGRIYFCVDATLSAAIWRGPY